MPSKGWNNKLFSSKKKFGTASYMMCHEDFILLSPERKYGQNNDVYLLSSHACRLECWCWLFHPFFFLLLVRSWAVFSFGCLALVCWLPCLAFSFGFWNLWPSMWYLLSASLGLSERKTSCIPLITSSIVRFAVANTWPLFCSSLQSWHVGIQCCCFTICNGCFLLLPPQLSHYLWGLF